MDLGGLLNFINYISNKEQSGKTLGADEANECLQYSNLELYRRLVKEDESNEKTSNALMPLKVIKSIPVDSFGYAVKPTDYRHFKAARHSFSNNGGCVYNGNPIPIELIQEEELGDRLSNTIKFPTLLYPICVIRPDSIQFFPKEINVVELVYYRYPVTPKYATRYNVDTDREEYIKSLSVQPEWDDEYYIDLAEIILSYIGINLREGALSQYTQMAKVENIPVPITTQ